MKILLTGKTGQVGYELEGSLQGLGTVIALDRNQMDLANLRQVRDVVRAVQPDLIINAAAYTAVDKAESEPELAMRINGDAPGVMAEEARKLGASIIHYSTDYVFDGAKRGLQGELVQYTEDDTPNPVNAYGKSKLAGELAIAASGCSHLILRTSWVYGMRGKNFLLTILRLAKERDELSIVSNQYGTPTWSRTISDITSRIVLEMCASETNTKWWEENSGTYHLVPQGNTTWYGFAQEIVTQAGRLGLLTEQDLRVRPIASKDYPTPAIRPVNSLLNGERLAQAFNIIRPYWADALSECIVSARV